MTPRPLTPGPSRVRPARVERSAFWPLASLRITVEPAPEPQMTADQQRRWDELQRATPALFDGPIYTVSGIALPGDEPASPASAPGKVPAAQKPEATIRCRRSRYHEVLLRRPGAEVLLLSVTGLLLCQQGVLLGQRGRRLRSYPGMWEIGPAGGVDPTGATGNRAELTPADVQAALHAEIHEEIGLDIDTRSARLVGVCTDEAARSLDIVMQVELPAPPPVLRHGEGWEYEDAGWTPIDQLPALVRQRRFIAPSLAIMLSLGWIAPDDVAGQVDQPPPPPAGAG